MKAIFKRYSTALLFLLIVTTIMLIATMGVMLLGENMVKEMDIDMKPRGENLVK